MKTIKNIYILFFSADINPRELSENAGMVCVRKQCILRLTLDIDLRISEIKG